MLDAEGPAPRPQGWDPFFMECSNTGQILWMNAKARNRLGAAANLFDAINAARRPEALRLLRLRGPGEGRQFSCFFRGSDRQRPLPVQLTRLLGSQTKVLISAKVRERESDAPFSQQAQLQMLLTMAQKAVWNYSRLAAVEEHLGRRRLQSRPHSRGQIGEAMSETRERERQRIAQVLHTGVGQSLAAIRVNLDLMHTRHPEASLALGEALANIQSLAEQALSEVRSVSQKLHPPDWQRLNLVQAVEYLWQTSGIPQKFHARLELHPLSVEPSQAIRVAVYRSAQEAISNVLRHSCASEATLSLKESGGRLSLTIHDDGAGFDVQNVLSADSGEGVRGIGLRSMQEAVRELGGQLDVRSGPEGTWIEVALPFQEE